MNATEKLTAIIDTLTAALPDAEKFDKGNASAGTRIRKVAQGVKGDMQDLRNLVQELKNAPEVTQG